MLALVIGALAGMTVVAFILLTERAGMRLYPVGGAPWRRLVFPVGGSLGIGFLLLPLFPECARQRHLSRSAGRSSHGASKMVSPAATNPE